MSIAGGGDCREFFEGAPLPKARARSLMTRVTTDARWFWMFCAFHGSDCPNFIGPAVCTATFAISGGTMVRRCCENICAGEALHCIYCKRRHAVMLCAATFLNRTKWTMVVVSFCHKPQILNVINRIQSDNCFPTVAFSVLYEMSSWICILASTCTQRAYTLSEYTHSTS